MVLENPFFSLPSPVILLIGRVTVCLGGGADLMKGAHLRIMWKACR